MLDIAPDRIATYFDEAMQTHRTWYTLLRASGYYEIARRFAIVAIPILLNDPEGRELLNEVGLIFGDSNENR